LTASANPANVRVETSPVVEPPDPAASPAARGKLTLWPGIGLVVANMIGAGVFLSTGYMAQELGPWPILLAWVAGAVIALAGTVAYGEVARMIPRSGGEYRFLSEVFHPALGYFAGWASMLLGFAAAIAVDGLAAGNFLATLLPGIDPRATGAIVIVAVTLLHAFNARVSSVTQNALVILKAVLVVGFVIVGLVLGSNAAPTWTPPQAAHGTAAVQAFARSLFFIAFAYSGWNAAAYASEEFRHPTREVPRSMIIGCALVAAFYLLVNWVFIANVTPASAAAVTLYEKTRVTLGHVIMRDLLGEMGGKVVSIIMIIAFVSAASAMVFVGPRVCAAMARDGYLPRAFAGRRGPDGRDRPPLGSVLLQGGLSLLILGTQRLQDVLQGIGALLMLFSALTGLSLFWARWFRKDLPRPATSGLVAAAVYVVATVWLFYLGFSSMSHVVWLPGLIVVSMTAYLLSRRFGKRLNA
jgi:APA family basic amino acid/polyamine antiporter